MKTAVGIALAAAIAAPLLRSSNASAAHGAARPTLVQASASQTAVFAGGCFWGIEAVFEHTKGVTSSVSGYAGGDVKDPDYESVSSGATGHAESVRVTFDPAVISYDQLLQIFFTVAHDPTQLNRQGPDVGTQYRSAIFYSTPEQKQAAEAMIARLTSERKYPRAIVTQVVPLKAFFAAEGYHQDYMLHHPNQPYIVINDAPKVEHLRKAFPSLYREWTLASR